MFTQFISLLNQYANLILVAVTTVYVILTWRMVTEMRRAREAESEPHLVATLIPFGTMDVKLRVHNAGRGPALEIKTVFWLDPANNTTTRTWLHPVLLSNAFEEFILPGNEFSLEKLASEHERLIVDLHWLNAFGRGHNTKFEVDLRQQKEGWSKVGFLTRPDDIPIQLEKIKDELSKIRHHFDKIESERSMQEVLEHYRKQTSPWFQLRSRVNQWFRKFFQKSKDA